MGYWLLPIMTPSSYRSAESYY